MASRTVSRLTPSRAASSRSGGSDSPGCSTPSRMVCNSRSTVSSNAFPGRTGRSRASLASGTSGSTDMRLQRSDVVAADAAVDEEGGGGDERRVVAGQKRHRGREFGRLRESPDGNMDEPPRGALRILGEQLLE